MNLNPQAFDSILATGETQRSRSPTTPPRPDPLFGVQALNVMKPIEYASLEAAIAALLRSSRTDT